MKLEVQNLRFSRTGGTFSLKDISFSVEKGTVFGIGGENGSGKSSLLKVLFRHLEYESGSIRIDGTDITNLKQREIARMIAYVPQETPLPMNMKVRDILEIASYSVEGNDRAVDRAEAICGISEFSDRDFSSLSGGEKRIVMFAAAVAQDSDIILMDEPTTFLDVEKRMRVLSIIHHLKETGKTLIGVFHEIEILNEHCDSMILLKDGLPLTYGNPREKINEEILSKAFNVEFTKYETPFGIRYEPIPPFKRRFQS